MAEDRPSPSDLRRANERLEARVLEQTREFRSLTAELSMAEHDVLQQVSHLLHDDLQQHLHALQLRAGLAGERASALGDSQLEAMLGELQQATVDAIALTRRISVELSPPILATEGLVDAVRWLTTQMRDLHGLHVSIDDRGVPPLGRRLRVFLFQVVRELLFNVVKHAGVGAATVALGCDGDAIVIVVSDDGAGFDDGGVHPTERDGDTFGLPAAAALLRLAGGSLAVRSAPGRGTTATVTLPLGGEGTDA